MTEPSPIEIIEQAKARGLKLSADGKSWIQVGNPDINLECSQRGWKIASVGLLFSFNIYIVAPLGIYDIMGIGRVLFLVIIGTPIAFAGLIMSIGDKWGVGKKNILVEIVVLILLSMNAFVFANMGAIGD